MITVNPIAIAPGAYEIKLDQLTLDQIDLIPTAGQNWITAFSNHVAGELGLRLLETNLLDYTLALDHKQADELDRAQQWHTDFDYYSHEGMDCLLFVYNVIPNATEQTGLRIGFRNKDNVGGAKFLDITIGTAILVNHTCDKYEHKVEPYKSGLTQRYIVSMSLSGFNGLNLEEA